VRKEVEGERQRGEKIGVMEREMRLGEVERLKEGSEERERGE
jgi:hypothetical protein